MTFKIHDSDTPPVSDETLEKLNWRLENSNIKMDPMDFVKKVVAVVKEYGPTPMELADYFDKDEMASAVTLLYNWKYATNNNTNNSWKISHNRTRGGNGGRGNVVKKKTGNVETITSSDSDMVPDMSVDECKDWMRDYLQDGSALIKDISEDFHQEHDLKNFERLAYAMDEMFTKGEIIMGQDPPRWTLIK